MSSYDRLSYVESNESVLDYSSITSINPCKNLTDVFNSVYEEDQEPDHLKVYLRIRPLLSEENITSQDGNVEILNGKNILLTAPSGSHAFKNKPQGITKVAHRFTFSRVYSQEAKQKELFEDTTQDLVKELVNGQNCLLFTYGATNSGKTYTIQGTNSDPGLLRRTLDTLFRVVGDQQYMGNDLRPQHFCGVVRLTPKEIAQEEDFRERLFKLGSLGHSLSRSTCSLDSRLSKETDICCIEESSLSDSGRNSDSNSKSESVFDAVVDDENAIYAVYLSFAEIYNEYIYDLLDRSTLSKKSKKSPLVLGEDRNGAIYIKGLKEVRVKSTEEAQKILEVGKQSLHFAATKLNHHSSRSHCIFTLKLFRLADASHPHVARVSMLSLCDLAGAERAGKTMNSMDRLKEASNINTSLLVLGRCLAALRQNQVMNRQVCGPKKAVPIPYRDSKVTRLFQSFFMGRGKVALIVNISMSNILFDETLKVLKFSALASKVTITHEKPPPPPVLEKSKRSSQFSRIFGQSLNLSTNSSRLSIPWNNKSFGDITFGGGENKESKMLAVTEEVEEEEEVEDEKYEALVQLIDKLKEKLLKVNQEKVELESNLRKELCDAFGKKIVQIEESWRNRVEEQGARAEEFMDWRINHVMGSVKKSENARKRLRPESDDDEEMVPSILLVREEIKAKEIEEEKNQLEDENAALKSSLKSQIQATKLAQEEKSKLLFQLAENNRQLDRLEKEKMQYDNLLKNKSCSLSETVDRVVAAELQLKIQNLEKAMQEKDKEMKNVREMLMDAADDFINKEHEISLLTSSLAAAQDSITKQSVVMQELESQLNETKDMLASQGEYLEEREQEVHNLRRQEVANKSDVIALEDTFEEKSSPEKEINSLVKTPKPWLTSEIKASIDQKHKLRKNSRKGLIPEALYKQYNGDLQAQIRKAKRNHHEREKSELQSALENAKVELEQTKQLLEKEKKDSDQLASDNNDQESEMHNLKSELFAMHKKCMNLEAENVQFQTDISNLESQLPVDNEYDEATNSTDIYDTKIEALEEEVRHTLAKYDESEKKSEDLLEEITMVRYQMKEIKEGKKSLEEKYHDVNSENELLSINIAELETCLRIANDNKESNIEEVNRLKLILSDKDKELLVQSSYVEESTRENEVCAKKIENLEEALILKEQMEKQCWKQVTSMREIVDTYANENVNITKQLQDYELTLSQKEKDRENLLVEKEDLLTSKNELQNNLKNLEERLTKKISDQAGEIDSLKSKVVDLEEKNSTIQIERKDSEEIVTKLQNVYETSVLKFEEEREQCEKLKEAVSQLEDKSTKLTEQLDLAKREETMLKNKICELDNSLSDAEITKLILNEKELKLKEEKAKVYSRVLEIEASLEEKEDLINNLNSKIVYLDKKGSEAEDEIQPLRSKCLMLEKEVAALREARNEEVNGLRTEMDEKEMLMQQKDQEINTLQQEIKRMLQISAISEVSDRRESSKTIESDEIMLEIRERLRISELERSSLLDQVSSLQQELSDVHDTTKSTNTFLEPAKSKTVTIKNSETSEVDSVANETPAKSRQTRSTRARRTKKEFEDYLVTTPDNFKLALDTSDDDLITPVSKITSAKGRKGRTLKNQKASIAESPEIDFKVPPSSRKKNLRFESNVHNESDDDDDNDEYVPETKSKSKRTTRTKSKSTSKPYNPHLENKENAGGMKNSTIESAEDAPFLPKTTNASHSTTTSRTRRGRPLYNLDVYDRFECSPELMNQDMISQQKIEESLSTIVKRKLRSKVK